MLPDQGAGLRSLLFAPGDREDLANKALASQADGIILDLEDAVAPDAKPAARATVRALLDSADRQGKPVFVRINALETGMALADLAAVLGGRPWGIVVPKCHLSRDLPLLGHYLDALETREGLGLGSTRILAIATETALTTLDLAHAGGLDCPRLWGVMWGSEDLAASLGAKTNRGADGAYTFPFQMARAQCLYAAAALGVVAVDAVWTAFRDSDGLQAETAEGLRDGFAAKAAIHPAQCAIINSMMTPAPAEVEWAGQVLELLQDQALAQLDGRMIDLAHKRIAEKIMARAQALDL